MERNVVSDFRPPLEGCVTCDRRMASALNVFYCEALAGIVTNVRYSLECRGKDQRADQLFYRMAEGELAEFRTLGELILALGGEVQLCRQRNEMRRGRNVCDVSELLQKAAEGEARRIDGYEGLLSHTSDRVVHSVLSGIMARHRRNRAQLEHFSNGY